jgi:hypothetical protein
LIQLGNAYILPQIYREWIPISFKPNYHNKPRLFNIGNLPMKLIYHNNTQVPYINSCPKLGLSLDSHDSHESLGTIINKNGLLFWSYKSFINSPYSSSNNLHFYKFQIDINHHFISFILLIIHDFLRNIPIHIDKKIYKRKNKLFISYKHNKLLFIYPYTIYIKHSVNDKTIFYENIYIYPIENNKTRLFVFTNNFIYKFFLYLFYLSLNSLSSNHFKYKYLLITDTISLYILKIFENYMCIFDDSTIYNFIINKRYY